MVRIQMKSKKSAKKNKAKNSGKAKIPAKDIELDPDAWPKFEALVRSAAKMGHKPHNIPSTKARKK